MVNNAPLYTASPWQLLLLHSRYPLMVPRGGVSGARAGHYQEWSTAVGRCRAPNTMYIYSHRLWRGGEIRCLVTTEDFRSVRGFLKCQIWRAGREVLSELRKHFCEPPPPHLGNWRQTERGQRVFLKVRVPTYCDASDVCRPRGNLLLTRLAMIELVLSVLIVCSMKSLSEDCF